jgi:hypothetical protein
MEGWTNRGEAMMSTATPLFTAKPAAECQQGRMQEIWDARRGVMQLVQQQPLTTCVSNVIFSEKS